MATLEEEPLREPPNPLPPSGPPWLPVAINGTLSGALFGIPGLLAILSPVPVLISYRRYGAGKGLAASAVGLVSTPVFAAVLASTVQVEGAQQPGVLALSVWGAALAYGLAVAVPAGLLAWGLHRDQGGVRAISLAAFIYLLFVGVLGVGIGLMAEGGPGKVAGDYVETSLTTAIEMWRERASGDAAMLEAVADLEVRRSWYQRWGTRLFPGLAAVFIVLGMWVNLVYTRWFTITAASEDDLTLWSLPMGVMYAFMGCAAAVVTQVGPVSVFFPSVDLLLIAGANGLLLLAALYWLQGVAVANFFFLRLRLGPMLRMLGVGAQAILLIYPATSMFFGAAGLADAWFDIRRLDRTDASEAGADR